MQPETTLPTALDWSGLALFLDFDGTLAPLVDRPEAAAMSPGTQAAVERLAGATGGALAVLSGRALGDLKTRLAPLDVPASGSHGLEISGLRDVAPPALTGGEVFAHATAEVTGFAAQHGLLAEEKPGAITIHYRRAPAMAARCRALVDGIVTADPALRALHGNMVSEVALAGMDKGKALRHVMRDTRFAGRVPVMAGDDVTDEDGFSAAQALGGFAIKVGPGPTGADYRAADIGVFLDWLEAAAMTEDRT